MLNKCFESCATASVVLEHNVKKSNVAGMKQGMPASHVGVQLHATALALHMLQLILHPSN
jgi:hypothetical protein